MFSFSRIRSSRAITVVVGGVVLATMATGVSLAAGAAPSGGYKACSSASHRLALQNAAGKCPRHFTKVSVGAQGPAGPRGRRGPAGTFRDAGVVASVGQGGPSFYPEGRTGWRSVTSPATGVYCLAPDATSNQANTSLLLSGGSPGAGGLGFVTWGGYCTPPGGGFGLTVDTSNLSGIAVNNIPFEAVIP